MVNELQNYNESKDVGSALTRDNEVVSTKLIRRNIGLLMVLLLVLQLLLQVFIWTYMLADIELRYKKLYIDVAYKTKNIGNIFQYVLMSMFYILYNLFLTIKEMIFSFKLLQGLALTLITYTNLSFLVAYIVMKSYDVMVTDEFLLKLQQKKGIQEIRSQQEVIHQDRMNKILAMFNKKTQIEEFQRLERLQHERNLLMFDRIIQMINNSIGIEISIDPNLAIILTDTKQIYRYLKLSQTIQVLVQSLPLCFIYIINNSIKRTGWEYYNIGGDYGAFISSLYVVLTYFRTLIDSTYYRDTREFYEIYMDNQSLKKEGSQEAPKN